MAENIDDVFRDWNVLGDPASGEYEPEKPRIRALLWQIQAAGGQSVTRNTLAQLNAVTPPTENYGGVVLNDPDPANNGYYARVAGAWVRGRGFPDTFAEGVLSGSGSAQTASFSADVNPADIEVFWSRVATENTGPMTLNGKPVLSVAGNPLVAGEWSGIVLYVDEGPNWRLLIDVNAAQIASQAASDALDAAVRAENAASSFTEVATNFRTVPALIADVTMGYSGSGADVEVGDGDIVSAGGYRFSVIPGSEALYAIETAAGVRFAPLENGQGEIAIEQFGAIGDGVFDNGAIFLRVHDVLAGFGGTITAGAGIFYTSRSLVIPPAASLSGQGEGSTMFIADPDGVFDAGAVVAKEGQEPTLLPALSASPNTGTYSLSFASAHGLSEGDVIVLHDPRPYSHSPYGSVYRSGEYAIVRQVTSSTAVLLSAPLLSDYALNAGTYVGAPARSDYTVGRAYTHQEVEVRLCDAYASGNLEGFSVVAPGSTQEFIPALQLRFCRGVSLENIACSGADAYTTNINRCFQITGRALNMVQRGVGSGGQQYGLVVGNSQEIDMGQSYFEAHRHAVSVGGGITSVAIVNRSIHVHDSTAVSPASGALDWHNNVEWSSYVNMTIRGGYGLISNGGNHNWIANIAYDIDDQFLVGAGMTGMDFRMSNVHGRSRLATSGRAVFGFSDAAAYMDDNMIMGGSLRIHDVSAECPNGANQTRLIHIANRGFPGTWDVQMSDLDFFNPANNSATVHISTVSGAAPSRIEAKGLKRPRGVAAGGAASLTIGSPEASTPISGISETGSVSFNATTGVSFVGGAVTFKNRFPKAPQVTVTSHQRGTGASDRIGAYVSGITTTGFSFWFTRVDDTGNFAAAATLTGSWEAKLEE